MNAQWAAGFVDGEGCIMLSTEGGITLAVVQIRREPLEALQALFGGKIYGKSGGNGRRLLRWHLRGWQAVEALRRMHPWLLVKGDEAELILRYADRGRRPEEREPIRELLRQRKWHDYNAHGAA